MKNLLKKQISVIIPTYNESGNIWALLHRISKTLTAQKFTFELIVIDDNSTDATKEIVMSLTKTLPVIFKSKKGKKGKAYSLTQGFSRASGEIIVMIDADLQYAPEAIPGMIEALYTSDIVVANRKQYNDSFARKVFSKTFRTIFGKALFGLKHDIQSGLKAFKREVIETISFDPSSQWTFDLEFLHRAHQAGFSIANFDIVFEKRKTGASNVRFIKTTIDIGVNALKLRAKRMHPIAVLPKNSKSMIGAGMRYKKNFYVTHTTLPHKVSAIRTFTLLQKNVILSILLIITVGLVFHPLITLQALVATLSTIYFIDVLFNLFVILKSLSFPQEITSSDEEIASLKDKDLPVYTILCPLYREAHVVPQFMEAIGNLSYPKEKLDVLLLLEEDDKDTVEKIRRMNLPQYVRVIVVPHSMPKTKPKACNYGLAFAKGEYLVVFDAEDIPEPLQLKKALLGFGKVPINTICLQAKLNYYNPHQNLLTRFFTAEYSLWFDVTLTGLQSINTTIPLGGTSNHFRTKKLREIEGWDPFNVTEDADLGMRLFKKGYKTAIIDSITLEEANSKYGNWLRQRSRWIKGYMQTYLVHIRETLTFTREQGIHSLIFQLIIGGKIAFVLINPFLWLATISYFTLYAYVGPQIEALYPSYVFYMALFSLVFGNFLFLYYYMIGAAKKGQWNLMKFIFLIPLYWTMISISAFIALYQLVFKPHYWEKTVHGFHLLQKNDEALTQAVVEEEEIKSGFVFPGFIKQKMSYLLKKDHFAAGSLIAANALSSVLAFAFSAYLGRVLTFEDFALVGLINGLISLVSVIFGSIGTTMTHRAGYLIGKSGEQAAIAFWSKTRKRAFSISIILSLLWILSSPFLLPYFKLSGMVPLLLFSPIILVSMAAAADRGLLFSKFNFKAISFLTIIEPLIKFLFVAVLVYFGFKNWAYSAIPMSVFTAFLIGWMFVRKNKEKIKNYKETAYKFPSKFFSVSLMSGVSSIIFLNLDVILAKHYLSPSDAGIYTLTALIGKMIYFLGGLASPFTMPFVSRNEGANKDSRRFLNLTLFATLLLTVPAFLAIAIFGNTLIPFMFGGKAVAALPYLTLIASAMVCFSVTRVLSDYYLAKKYYSFQVVAFCLGVTQLVLLNLFHSTMWSFVSVMSGMWIAYGILGFTLHIFSAQVKIVENNVSDFFGLFARLRTPKPEASEKLRILIFNWRDIKHKWAGGAEVYIHELAKRWVREGHSVTMFSGKGSKRPTNETIDGIQIYRRGGFYMVYFWAALYYVFKFRGKYDFIIDSENGIPFFTPLYAKEKKFLLIHHVHQEVFRKSLKAPFSWFALFLEAKLMPFVYRKVQVITVSPSSKQEILRHKLTKTDPIVIYNGVDLEIFKPGMKSKKPMVLYLGRLQYYKGLHVFIVAAKRILKRYSDTEFIIAGEGGEKEKLIKFAEKLRVSDKIKFVGKVNEEEKVNLFQKAWVFVNPSLMEGWGITTIEANACGTPAVASDVPGLRDSIKNPDTGILVPYKGYDGFSKTIAKLINDKKLRNKMSSESIKWASNFSWEKSANEFYSALNKSLGDKPKKKIRRRRFSFAMNMFTSLF